MLLEILGTLEGLSAEFALVGLEGDVNTNVRCDVVPLDCSGAASTPSASQAQVVCRLPANVGLAKMVLSPSALRPSETSRGKSIRRAIPRCQKFPSSPATGKSSSRKIQMAMERQREQRLAGRWPQPGSWASLVERWSVGPTLSIVIW